MKLTTYFQTWWEIIFRPIHFYTKLRGEEWRGGPLSFLITTSWLLGFVASLVVFFLQYVPIGKTLIEGVEPAKYIFILPVLVTLAFVFFLITFLILGGLFTSLFFVMFYVAAIVLHYVFLFLGGSGSLNQKIQNIFYSSAALLFAVIIFGLMFLTKQTAFSFELFRSGFNAIYFLICLYMYGLWAVSGRKNYGIAKWKAFLGALIPLVVLLIFGFLFDKIALSKFAPWIS